ncbi:Lrp/AsnC family transcriptional regulator [Marinibactrum halimedae]|uniref:Transcriptional regulator n=1 Tax=Marinibactrum halimedae TaxID=1444977 RepID=A0AA37T6Y1_9GAMM|nr:Lrp/AsnC family transcriptional regulator [Marinibactrum halimedae]MCD9459501.1 Lrp/AsnC family transcriptional regulator [Marinibactrum halimedae]GLS28155.1 transcriptional regulator [Marinibactrum halimedae]
MDKIDRFLLSQLQRDARQSAAQLGEQVGLSPSPCARRIRQLEEQGFIEGVYARLNTKQLGFHLTVFVHVRLSAHHEAVILEFEEAIQSMDEVLNCTVTSGKFDYLLEVLVKDLESYELWMKSLHRLSVVSQIDSAFSIRKVKSNGVLPLT